jgi:hypothetical protein
VQPWIHPLPPTTRGSILAALRASRAWKLRLPEGLRVVETSAHSTAEHGDQVVDADRRDAGRLWL